MVSKQIIGGLSMYKAMLVDDDVPMLKYLENIMNWEEKFRYNCGFNFLKCESVDTI